MSAKHVIDASASFGRANGTAALHDQAGVIASYDVTMGRFFSTEPTPNAAPSFNM